MKITFIVASYHPMQSGPGNAAYWMAKYMVQMGHDVSVITAGNLPEKLIANQFHKTDYGNIMYIRAKSRKYNLKFIQQSIRHAKDADVVHLMGLFLPACVMVAFYSAISGRSKVIWTVAGVLYGDCLAHHRLRKNLMISLIQLIKKEVYFHVTAESEMDRIKSIFGNVKSVLIPHFIGFELQKKRSSSVKPYLLFLGRIDPKKALENLIQSLTLSRQFMTRPVTLIISGKGDRKYEKRLKSLVRSLALEEKVSFTGYVEEQNKNQILCDALALLMPSHTENFGMVALESLANGTPVIASKNTPWNHLSKYNAGYWVENTPESLSRVLDRFLQLPEKEYRKMRTNSCKLAGERFDYLIESHIWDKFYKKIQ